MQRLLPSHFASGRRLSIPLSLLRPQVTHTRLGEQSDAPVRVRSLLLTTTSCVLSGLLPAQELGWIGRRRGDVAWIRRATRWGFLGR